MDDDERAERSAEFKFNVPAELALPTLFEIRRWHPGGELPRADDGGDE